MAPLFYVCSLAKKAIVVVDELSAQLGEMLVMLQCCGISSGYFVLKNYITPEKLQPLLKGTILENYKFVVDETTILREELLVEATKTGTPKTKNNTGTVPVDHAFNVKGIGTVILGVVADGIVQKHDKMNVFPGTKTTQIRSIQKNDNEFNSAEEGDRVGLALKNIKVDDVDRGTVLTNDTTCKASNKIQSPASLIKYWSTPIMDGMVLHLGHWMQVLKCKVEAVNEGSDWRKPKLTLSLEKEIVHYPNDRAILMYLEGGKLRVIGTIELP